MKRKGIFSIETRLGQIVRPPKKRWLRTVVLIFLTLVLITTISIGTYVLLEKYCVVDLATWTSSLPSYWGGVIGGVISGSISFLGVFWTIKYYRNSDLTKSRIEHMPFIHILLKRAQCIRTIKEDKENVINFPGRFYKIDRNSLVEIDLSLENIGNGFANTLVLHLGWNAGGEAFQRLLKIGEKDYLQLRFYLDDTKHISNISFAIQYVDCMTNEYIQHYTVKCSSILSLLPAEDIAKNIQIENGYPQFIGQIHQLGQ